MQYNPFIIGVPFSGEVPLYVVIYMQLRGERCEDFSVTIH
jgi:hypothetical protein